MNEEKQQKFFYVPIVLLRELFTDKEKALNEIIQYGVWNFSKKFPMSIDNVAKQTMYGYYRGGLPNELHKRIKKLVDQSFIPIDEDYNGFMGDSFDPDTSALKNFLADDDEFYNLASEYAAVKTIHNKNLLGVSVGSVEMLIKRAKEIHKKIPAKCPMVMVSTSKVFEFRDKEKPEYDLMQFAYYLGIRSILGTKTYWHTNHLMIRCRAFGYSSPKELPSFMTASDELERGHLGNLFKKYSTTHYKAKLINTLRLNWRLIAYSKGVNGVMVSMKRKMSQIELIAVTKERQLTNRLKRQKEEDKENELKALELMKQRHQTRPPTS